VTVATPRHRCSVNPFATSVKGGNAAPPRAGKAEDRDTSNGQASSVGSADLSGRRFA
jgi:hypothetical protein